MGDQGFQDFLAKQLSGLQVRVLAEHQRSLSSSRGIGAASFIPGSVGLPVDLPPSPPSEAASSTQPLNPRHFASPRPSPKTCGAGSSSAIAQRDFCQILPGAAIEILPGAAIEDPLTDTATPSSKCSTSMHLSISLEAGLEVQGESVTPSCKGVPPYAGAEARPVLRRSCSDPLPQARTRNSPDALSPVGQPWQQRHKGGVMKPIHEAEHNEAMSPRHSMCSSGAFASTPDSTTSMSRIRDSKRLTQMKSKKRTSTDILLTEPLRPHEVWFTEVEEAKDMLEVFKSKSHFGTFGAELFPPNASLRRSKSRLDQVTDGFAHWKLARPLPAVAAAGRAAGWAPRCVPMDSTSKLRICWDLLGVLLMLYDIVFIPLQIFDMEGNLFTRIVQWASIAFWSLDIPASFFVGFNREGVMELRVREICKRYVRTWFIFDLVLVALDLAILTADGSNGTRHSGIVGARTFRIFRILRTFRILRLFKLPLTLAKLQENVQSEYAAEAMGIVKLTVSIVLINHIIACCWYGITNLDGDGSDSWVSHGYMSDASTAYLYTTSLHWSLTQFTPASMEIYPRNVRERTFTIVVILFALVTFSSFVSSITNAMTQLRNMNSEQPKQFMMLQRYCRSNNISTMLCVRVRRHLEHQLLQRQRHVAEKDVLLFQLLSEPLRVELHYEVFAPVLRVHPLFERYDRAFPSTMNRICHKALTQCSLSRGDVLFSRGDRSGKMYFCRGGTLVYRGGLLSLENFSIEEGHWLSEAVLWTPWVHHGDTRAATECTLVALDAERFHDAVRHNRAATASPSKYAFLFVDHLNNLGVDNLSDIVDSSFDIARAVEVAWMDAEEPDDPLNERSPSSNGFSW